MAKVIIEFNEDVEGYGLDLDIEDDLKKILNLFKSKKWIYRTFEWRKFYKVIF